MPAAILPGSTRGHRPGALRRYKCCVCATVLLREGGSRFTRCPPCLAAVSPDKAEARKKPGHAPGALTRCRCRTCGAIELARAAGPCFVCVGCKDTDLSAVRAVAPTAPGYTPRVEALAQKIYGCSQAEAYAINRWRPLNEVGSPAQRYRSQRKSAFERELGWEITFSEWLRVWTDSGKWGERGSHLGGYCMARHGDLGPYAIWNVSIQATADNTRDGFKNAQPNGIRKGFCGLGSGRGWTFDASRASPYRVEIGNGKRRRCVGSFKTAEEAEAAYRTAATEARKVRESELAAWLESRA